MPSIAFEKTVFTFTILNPFNNFAPETHRVEVRKDPLLGDTLTFGSAFFGRQGRQSGFPAVSPLNETARQIQMLLRIEF